MPALIQFVDKISASPTVRLDVNDASAWFCGDFKAPPPRLRRSESSNSMGDGGTVSSSSYENRTLELELALLNSSTEDAAATEMQKLWRELDRPNNYLRYQREGATKPVFFRLFRSDVSDLEELWTTPIARTIKLELLAEPFALGLMETLGPYTINNDPAAGSNPCYVDISGVIGDVAADAIFWNTSANRAATLMAIRHGSFTDTRPWLQAESMTLGTDTTNPGGGPDAAISGTGTNNFVRTSFATVPGLVARVTGAIYTTITTEVGTWVVYAVVRRSDSTSVINVGVSSDATTPPTELPAVPQSTARQLVRLGRFSTDGSSNYGGQVKSRANVLGWALRSSGGGTLDWDCLIFVPADSAMLEAVSYATSTVGGDDDVFDGVADRTSAIAGGGSPFLATETGQLKTSGRIPQLMPNVTSRLFFLTSSTYNTTGLRTHVKTETNALTVNYWPRYLFVRPVST